jgi:hypothetical protein
LVSPRERKKRLAEARKKRWAKRWRRRLPLFEIARVSVHLDQYDQYQKAARFGKSCGFYWH